MELKEAREVLDGVIPPPNNKMVDLEHLNIAIAWATVKSELDRRSTAGDNAPLTLEELRQMDGRSVWLVVSERYKRLKHWDGWSTVIVDDELKRFGVRIIRMFKPRYGTLVYYNEDYGKDWTAYCRPPESEAQG